MSHYFMTSGKVNRESLFLITPLIYLKISSCSHRGILSLQIPLPNFSAVEKLISAITIAGSEKLTSFTLHYRTSIFPCIKILSAPLIFPGIFLVI